MKNVKDVAKELNIAEELVVELAANINLELSESKKRIVNIDAKAVVPLIRKELTKYNAIKEIAAAKNNNEKDDEKMINVEANNNNNVVVEGNEVKMNAYVQKVEGIKEQLAKGILTSKMIHFVFDKTEEEDKEVLTQLMFDAFFKKGQKNYKNQAAIKHFSKEMDLTTLRRIVYDIEIDKETDRAKHILYVEVQPVQEEEILRHIELVEKTVADSRMSLHGKTTEEICTISLGEGVRAKNDKARGFLKKLFLMLIGDDENRVTIVVNRSGLAKVYFNKNKYKLNKGQVAYEYELLGITPSGLRSASIMLAAVSKQEYGMEKENIDRRVELLTKSSDNAFAMSFTNGKDENGNHIFSKEATLEKLFSNMGRVLMQATASVRVGKFSTYCVFDNFGQNACHFEDENLYNTVAKVNDEKVVSCEDTQDGACVIAGEKLAAELNEKGVPCSLRDVAGMCFQARGGALKSAAKVKRRKGLVTAFRNLVARGNEIKVVVLKGRTIPVDMLLNDKTLFNEFLDNVEGLFDTNAMKLMKHDPEFEMVMLKKAYASETKLNMVINIAMLMQDKKAASELLLRKSKNFINDSIKDNLGVEIVYDEDGAIEGTKIDFEKMLGINNDSQTSVWASKNNPEFMTSVAPGTKKAAMKSAATTISNIINRLRIEVDSKYLVVQSDEAPMYGLRLLHSDEVYCPDLAGVPYVSAARHPISGPYAITTLKVISNPLVLLKRINDWKCSLDLKQMFIDDLCAQQGYALIPADHYLMEKHDGMDFDIDSMQFFKDQEVVGILSQIKDIGTKINRDADVEHRSGNISINFSADEEAIKAFKASIMNGDSKLTRPVAKKAVQVSEQTVKFNSEAIVVRKTKSKGETTISCVPKQADGTYSMDFKSMGCLILDYFLNPIDPVGYIATGFYNNALLSMTLEDDDTNKEDKELIAQIISNTFSCSCQSNYVSPIVNENTFAENKKRYEIVLDKEKCTEVMMRYAESSGSVAETKLFLKDTCYANRYPAESSIDAAKKMYKIVDMFNLGLVVKALGSDKSMKTRTYEIDDETKKPVEESNELFAYYVNNFNKGFEEAEMDCKYSTNNFFDVPMLVNDTRNNFDISGMSIDEIESKKLEGKIPGVADPLYVIRQKLLSYANSLLVYIAKELEVYVKSEEAQAIRNEYTNKYITKFTDNDEYFMTDKVIKSALSCYITITNDIREQEEKAKLNKDVVEIEETTAREYLTSKALVGCRNYARLAFRGASTPLSKEEIGCAAVYNMICAFDKNTDSCVTTNTAMLDMFLPEIIAFMNQEGLNTQAGEKILYAVNENGRQVKLDELVGKTVTGLKGHGNTEDGIHVVFDNKKASCDNATVIKNEYGYYCVFDRKTIEDNDEVGVYFPAKFDTGIAAGVEFDFDQFVTIEFKKVFKVNGITRFNSIVGTTADNTEVVIAELIVNAAVSDILNGKEISEENIRFFKADKSLCVHINEPALLAELSMTTDDGLDFNPSFTPANDDAYFTSYSDSIPMVDDEIQKEIAAGKNIEDKKEEISNDFSCDIPQQ